MRPNHTPLVTSVYGSKLYGTDTPSSDTDYKAIYAPRCMDLLLGHRLDTYTVQDKASSGVKMQAGDVETTYIPIHTFVRDVAGGQAYALELLFSNVLMWNGDSSRLTQPLMTMLRYKCIPNSVRPMVAYANNMAKLYGVRNKRMEMAIELEKALDTATGALADHIAKITEVMAANNVNDPQFIEVVDADDQKGPSLRLLTKQYYFNTPIRDIVRSLQANIARYGDRVKNASDSIDWKSTYHAVRMYMQANELLSTGQMSMPLRADDRDVIMKIRQGELHIDEVRGIIEVQLERLTELERNPHPFLVSVNDAKVNAETLLREWLQEYYEVWPHPENAR